MESGAKTFIDPTYCDLAIQQKGFDVRHIQKREDGKKLVYLRKRKVLTSCVFQY